MSEPVPHFRLLGTPGLDQFGIRIERYEHPGYRNPGDYWLVVRGDIQWNDQRWRFFDPCLTIDELADLIGWFKRTPSPGEPAEFMECLLKFEVAPDMIPWSLAVTLRGEAVPEHVLPGIDRWETGIRLQLESTPAQVERVIEGLEADLKRFPPR